MKGDTIKPMYNKTIGINIQIGTIGINKLKPNEINKITTVNELIK